MNIAIILAAGRGSRMGSREKKQFMMLGKRPLVCFCIDAFMDSYLIDEIILVTSLEDMEYLRENVLEPFYDLQDTKPIHIISGGDYRCLSVYKGIKKAREIMDGKKIAMHTSDNVNGGTGSPGELPNEPCYIFIHDGARPFVNGDIIERNYEAVKKTGACVTAIPAQDTIRRSVVKKERDRDIFICGETIPRQDAWLMQTPQTFDISVALPAFEKLLSMDKKELSAVTDDVMVVMENEPHRDVTIVEGAKTNIKITTKDDLIFARGIMNNE